MTEIEQYFKKNKDYTAVFCANDSIAVGVYMALFESGYKVPDDYSVIGVDDNPMYHYLKPKITTIQQPLEKLGNIAANKFISYLNSKRKQKLININAPPELVEKESVISLV